MRYLLIIGLALVTALAGCSKKEEPESTLAEAVAEQPAAQEIQPAEEIEKAEEALPGLKNELTGGMEQAVGTAMKMASTMDWGSMSWDKVADIKFEDKAKLLAWAAPQLDTVKDQLTKSAMTQGLSSLGGLSDSGWQGTLKSAVEALEAVRNASPETWEMAKGSLMMAWQALQDAVNKQTSS